MRKAPAKRSQHANATYRNIVGRNMLQQVATPWPNASNMLRPTMLRYVALACCDRLAGALRITTQNYTRSVMEGILP